MPDSWFVPALQSFYEAGVKLQAAIMDEGVDIYSDEFLDFTNALSVMRGLLNPEVRVDDAKETRESG